MPVIPSVKTVPYLFSPSDAAFSDALNADVQAISPGINIKNYGAVGDGTTDDTAAVQSAVNAAVAANVALFVPPASVGYLITSPLNLTNLDGSLLVFGSGMTAPTFGLATNPLNGGSILLGSTGANQPVFDCSGSNNIIFRDLTIIAEGQSSPSGIGILFSTSTTSPPTQSPGGANCAIENVAIYMSSSGLSLPVAWVYGCGAGHFYNLWTVGQYGVVMSGTNTLGLTSNYVTLGPSAGVDGISCNSCVLLGYGNQPVLLLEDANDHSWTQLYINTINGGVSFSGQNYPCFFKNIIDVKIKIEDDYFPSMFHAQGTLDLVTIEGIVFPNATPISVGTAAVGFFDGTSVTNCNFLVEVISSTSLPNSNYYYTTVAGASPTVNAFKNTNFLFNTAVSANCASLNVTNSAAVPFFNLTFNGDADSPGLQFLVNGSAAAASNERYFVNGKAFGTG